MVLQWIANPRPSGLPGSIPGDGVFWTEKSNRNLTSVTGSITTNCFAICVSENLFSEPGDGVFFLILTICLDEIKASFKSVYH